jgi:VWFA-related protein
MRPIDLAGLVVNGEMLGKKIQSDKAVLVGLLDGIGPPNQSRFNDMRTWPRLLSEEEAVRIGNGDEKIRDLAVQRACTERAGDCDGPARYGVEVEVENKSRLIASESARDGQTALTTLLALANGLGQLPGPKSVILFSEGFYTGDFQERVRQVAGLSARNRVRISTLDARGLGSDVRQQGLLGEAPVVGVTDFGANLGFDPNADVLTTLALDTGGLRIKNRNILRPALDDIATQEGTYYMLGYSPREPFDGSYRAIEVRTTRADVLVRARRGYLAVKVSEAAAAPAAELPGGRPAGRAAAGDAPPTAPPAGGPPPGGAAAGTAVAAPGAAPPPAANPATGLRLRPDGPANVATLSAASGASPAASEAAAKLAREGWDLYSAGKVEAARDRLAEASAAGADIWVDYALGHAEFALDHFDAAIATWERFRMKKPDFEPVHFDLADAYLRLNRTDDTLAVLREAQKRWPADPETHNAVGVVLVRRGALDDAIDAFHKAASAAPSDPIAYYNLGRAYQMRYQRTLRTVGQRGEAGRSVADRDRQSALENYKKHVALGGTHADQAREAISLLNWR